MPRRFSLAFAVAAILAFWAVAVDAKTIVGDYVVKLKGADIFMNRRPVNQPIEDRTTLKVVQQGDRITMEFGAIGAASPATIFRGRTGNGRFAAVWWYKASAHETKVVWGTIGQNRLDGRMIYPRVADGATSGPGWLEVSFEAKKTKPSKPPGRIDPGRGPLVQAPGERLDIQEDCLAFEPRQLQVKAEAGRYLLTDGRSRMKVFPTRAEARSALKTIQHYGMDRHCFVGRPDPSMEYWLADGRAPSGRLAQEDCIAFDPGRLELKREGKRWLLTDGGSRMRLFSDRQEAEKALRLIRRYGFTRTCYIGRPDPSMVYFRD